MEYTSLIIVAVRSSPSQMLRYWVRIPLEGWMFAYVYSASVSCEGCGLAAG
jgi:hypothetical protein